LITKKLSWNPFGGSLAPLGEQVGYSNDGEVLWYSGFAQVEYSKDALSAFLQGSVSNQSYQRIDNFVKDGSTLKGQTVNTKTGFKDLIGYNVKGGANYNINDYHNVFANIGYYSKQPFLNTVYPNNQQLLNPNLTNEKIFSAEIGYGFRSPKLSANVNLYRTEWKDRWLRRSNVPFQIPDASSPTGTTIVNGYTEINGLTQLHMGVEFDAVYKPVPFLDINAMFSLGDYTYKGNASGTNFDDNNNPINGAATTTLYLDGVKVGGSSNNSIPQLTSSLGATIRPVKDLNVYGTWRYVGKIYSTIDAQTFTTEANQARGTLKLPDFNLLDVGASYKIRLRNHDQYFTVGFNIYNLLDTTYISDGATNIFGSDVITANNDPDKGKTYEQAGRMYDGIATANRVFFGFGRTWAANLSFNF